MKSKRNATYGFSWQSRVKAFLCHPTMVGNIQGQFRGCFPKENSQIFFKILNLTLQASMKCHDHCPNFAWSVQLKLNVDIN